MAGAWYGQEHGRGQLDRGLVGNMAVGGGMNLGGTVWRACEGHA